MKLSEYEGEQALDILADLIEPATAIMGDKRLAEILQDEKAPKSRALAVAIKNHKKEVIEILAVLDGVPVSEYKVNVFTLPKKLLEILNDPMLTELFRSQGLKTEASSGSATENIEANEH